MGSASWYPAHRKEPTGTNSAHAEARKIDDRAQNRAASSGRSFPDAGVGRSSGGRRSETAGVNGAAMPVLPAKAVRGLSAFLSEHSSAPAPLMVAEIPSLCSVWLSGFMCHHAKNAVCSGSWCLIIATPSTTFRPRAAAGLRRVRNGRRVSFSDAFSSREPVSTSLENAMERLLSLAVVRFIPVKHQMTSRKRPCPQESSE